MTTIPTTYTLKFNNSRTWIASAIFIAGNIVLPQLCHLFNQGGLIWLPIYFFTLIGAYKYGWRVGLLTALTSPVVNSALFGMPPTAMLPIVTIKSTILALSASLFARLATKAHPDSSSVGRLISVHPAIITFISVVGAVVSYQLLGGIAEWAITQSLSAAVQDITLGLPGILLQIIAGTLLLRHL